MSEGKRKRVARKQAAPLQEASPESATLAPYLIRFYLSTANARSEALNAEIHNHLIGQIVWPADALKRVAACFPKREDEDDGIPPHWISRGSEHQGLTQYPTPVHPVDQFLCERSYPFHSAFQMLYNKRQDWLRNVLHVSLEACQKVHDAINQTKIDRLAAVGQTFEWSDDDLALAALALHCSEYMSLCEWLDQVPDVGRDAALAYIRVLAIDRSRLRACLRPAGALSTSGLYLIDQRNTHTVSFSDPP